MILKKICCKQLDCETSVCDWYECPHGATCEPVKEFYRFMQINDDPDDVQLLNGILFYTTNSVIAPQLSKEDRGHVAKRWTNEHK